MTIVSRHHQNRYLKFIDARASREAPLDGYHSHHIVPRCQGGSDEECNLVKLSPREHYLAHWMLASADDNRDLQFAFYAMSNFQSKNKNSKSYERARAKHSSDSSQRLKAIHQNPEFAKGFLKIASDRAKSLHRNPEFAKAHAIRQSEKFRKMNADPSFAAANSAKAKLQHLDAEFKAKLLAGYQNSLNDPNNKKKKQFAQWNRDAHKWNLAGQIHQQWVEASKPTRKGLAELIGMDQQRISALYNKFKSGWNPSQDPSWIEWKSLREFT